MVHAALASVVVAIGCSCIFVLLPLLAGDIIDVASVIGSGIAIVVTFAAVLALEK